MKKYIIEDLLKEARLVLGIDAEHYPWFAVYRFPNGKFCFAESKYGEHYVRCDAALCETIGYDLYDEALYFDIQPETCIPGVLSYQMLASECGYLALRHGMAWDVYCVSSQKWPTKMVDSAPTKSDAISLLSERIGFEPEVWENLSERGARYTPENIQSLDYNQIFVFGSNLQGRHLGGAAKCAVDNFHAVMGQGVGLQGKSYAIPTMFSSVEEIRPYVDDFIEFAAKNHHLEFLVTRIGCKIAGFKEIDIAPLFCSALFHKNIILPKSFVDILENR